MSNNKLVKINRMAEGAASFNRLGDIEQTLDKLWTMFQSQVNRNAELMVIIQQQQQDMQKINTAPVVIESSPAPQQLTNIETAIIPELGYEKLLRLKNTLSQTINVRADALQSIINIFHYLYQYGGEAYPEQLVSLSGISTATFYRHLTRMRESHIIDMKRGKAVVTEIGRKVYCEEISNYEQLSKAFYELKCSRYNV